MTVITPALGRGLKVFRDRGGIRVVAYPYAPGLTPMLHCDQGLIPSIRRSRLARLQLPGFFLASIYYLVLCARRYRPDVIHAHWFLPGGLAAAMVRPILGIPTITLGHGADFHLRDRRLVRWALAFVHGRCDVSLVVSRYLQGRAEAYGLPSEEIGVIPYGVDTDAFTPGPRNGNGSVVIGVARRLVPEKGVGDVIDAVAGIPLEDRRGMDVRIAGMGGQREELQGRVRSSGLSGQVKFLGPVPHREMPSFLRSLDVLVNPSGQEGLSTGNLEAIASGVPVIACQGVGNDEVIEDGRMGILYPPRDVTSLRQAILRAARSTADLRRMGACARKAAVERFSLERAAQAWEEAYHRALSGRGRPR